MTLLTIIPVARGPVRRGVRQWLGEMRRFEG